MTTEWTAKRLDGRPRNTLISIGAPGDDLPELFLAEGDGRWLNLDNGVTAHDAEWILDRALEGEEIQVVSAPVTALLADQTVRAAAQGHALGPANSAARIAIAAAIAHVTGESL